MINKNIVIFYGSILTKEILEKGLRNFYPKQIEDGTIKSNNGILDIEDAMEFFNCYINDREDCISIHEIGEPEENLYYVYTRNSVERSQKSSLKVDLKYLTTQQKYANQRNQDWGRAIENLFDEKFKLNEEDYKYPEWQIGVVFYTDSEEEG